MEKKNFYQDRISKLARHFSIFRRHLTPKKIVNLAKLEANYRVGRVKFDSKPCALKVEPTVVCNLRCPGCYRTPAAQGTPRKMMPLEMYKKVMDELGDYLLEVSLYDQGEPLLAPEIIQFILYAKEKNVGSIISSNFAMPLDDRKMVQMVEAGLDHLIVAIDGVTQETYEKYRRGGQIEKVLSNLKRFMKIREWRLTKWPKVEWQMIDFGYNKKEVEDAREMAKEIGVDHFNLVTDGYSMMDKNYQRQGRCPVLWSAMAVEFDGRVSACYINDHRSLYVGQADEGMLNIWRSETYAKLRKNHHREKEIYCQRCKIFD